jgi:hypothetical protein
MIDERTLEELFVELADAIPVPDDGPERVVAAAHVTAPSSRSSRSRFTMPLLAAAAIVVVAAVAAVVVHRGSVHESVKRVETAAPPATQLRSGASVSAGEAYSAAPLAPRSVTNGGATTGNGALVPPATSAASGAPAAGDAPKIVKTGNLDLQVARGTLRATVNRVTSTAVGLGGYVATSKSDVGGTDPTADVTIRVPVDAFETATTRLAAMPGVKVLSDGESGRDVTGQVSDLHARLTAATTERDSLLVVLSHAQSIGDILAVRDRISAVQTEIDQLQSNINTLDDQASFSSLAVSLAEKPAPHPVVKHAAPPSGLSKAWADGRRGFSHGIEWLLARSGGALIAVLAALALLFGLRFLYPVVRRARK